MIEPLKDLGGRKATLALSAPAVSAFPWGAASWLFVSPCLHPSSQPQHSPAHSSFVAAGVLPVTSSLCSHTGRVLTGFSAAFLK